MEQAGLGKGLMTAKIPTQKAKRKVLEAECFMKSSMDIYERDPPEGVSKKGWP
jgi:hypothetical protein